MSIRRGGSTIFVLVVMAVMVASTSVFAGDDGAPTMDGLTGGDQPWERAFDEALLEGREHYNSGDFDSARNAFIRAAQFLPGEAAPYRNLARTYNHMGQFDEATEYYDIYLRIAPDADDVETIAAERRGAVQRASDEPWRLPADQRMALRALERELEDGRALTAKDGGAWGLYQTLLGLGYAHPDLEELRGAMEERLFDELDGDFERHGDFIPLLDGEGWKLQQKRLQALTEVTRSPARLEEVKMARGVVEVGRALFDGDYERVDALGEELMEKGPEFRFVGLYRVVALERAGKPESALRALLELSEEGVFEAEGARKVEAMRARLLQQLGGVEDATGIYHRILMGDR